MKSIIALICLVTMSAAATAGERLDGTWTGNDRAAESIYGKISLNQKEISWGGFNKFNPKCKTTYKVARTDTDATYPGNSNEPVPGRTYTLFKLELGSAACAASARSILFALPSDQPGAADVVTFDSAGQQTGWHNFTKTQTGPR